MFRLRVMLHVQVQGEVSCSGFLLSFKGRVHCMVLVWVKGSISGSGFRFRLRLRLRLRMSA